MNFDEIWNTFKDGDIAIVDHKHKQNGRHAAILDFWMENFFDTAVFKVKYFKSREVIWSN